VVVASSASLEGDLVPAGESGARYHRSLQPRR